MCSRDDACLRRTCLREVSSRTHVSSRRVFAHLCIFTTTRVFARSVLGTCLCATMCLRDDASLRPTCLREVLSCLRATCLREVSSRTLCRRPFLGALVPDSVCLQNVSSVFGGNVHPPRRPQCLKPDPERLKPHPKLQPACTQ